jgi:transcriptional activator HAC1
VRPAVSVGRATALDGLNDGNFNFTTLSNIGGADDDLAKYLRDSTPIESDYAYVKDNVYSLNDIFKPDYDYTDGHDGALDQFDPYEFVVNHDDPHTSEIRSSDSFAETTSSLQPQFGASSYGCDDGGNAVSV